jgi:superfamily II DNA/RNA helicase
VRSTTLLNFTLKRAKFLVLDEADKLLTPRFQASLAYILPLLPPVHARQTLLFSATMTSNLERLGAAFQGLKKVRLRLFRLSVSLLALLIRRDRKQRSVCLAQDTHAGVHAGPARHAGSLLVSLSMLFG